MIEQSCCLHEGVGLVPRVANAKAWTFPSTCKEARVTAIATCCYKMISMVAIGAGCLQTISVDPTSLVTYLVLFFKLVGTYLVMSLSFLKMPLGCPSTISYIPLTYASILFLVGLGDVLTLKIYVIVRNTPKLSC